MTFHLQIVTPDGLMFDGQAEKLFCRTVTGNICILARHINLCTPLGMGEARVVFEDGSSKKAACIGGMLTVMNGECRLVATTWEWEDKIDKVRAERALEKARETLETKKDEREIAVATAHMKRALIRSTVAEHHLMDQ